MKNFMLAITLGVFGLLMTGQAQQQEQAPQEEITVTGCLQASGASGSYTLKTDAGGEVALRAGEDLQQHEGHTVRVTGTMDTSTQETTLQVKAIEHVSDSCSQ